jgi:nucleotide-binding universal stress UspA family protein
LSGDLLSWLEAEEVAMDEHPILVGYDGATCSGAALRWALSEAARRGVGVRLVRVLDLPRHPAPVAGGASGIGASAGGVEAQLLDEAGVALDKVGSEAAVELRGAVAVATAALPGPVVETLCEQSGEASMVVLGSRGMGGFAGLMLGSVSVAVAAHARCPVVVVREGMWIAPDGPVVVGVDGSDEARLAVDFAFAEARARHTSLAALHAAAPPQPRTVERLAAEMSASLLEAALHDCRLRYPEVPVTSRVVTGPPGQVLAAVAPGAQLLVVGSRGRGGFHGLVLGSVSQQVLHRARCPVAVVRRYPTVVRDTVLYKQDMSR